MASVKGIVASIKKQAANLYSSTVWTWPVLGTWAVDGDGARTNGGGSAGAVLADLTLTNAGATACKVYDLGTTTWSDVSLSSALTGWTANYQLTADAANEEVGDLMAFGGGGKKFAELAFDLSQLATWGADGGVWKYWNGTAYVVVPAGTFYDNTDTTVATTGLRAFQQVGAVTFYPPALWAKSTIDGVEDFWLIYEITALQVTQTPILNTKEHDIVSQLDVFVAPSKATLDTVRIEDGASTLHTATDVKWFIMDYTTGEPSSLFTFAQDKRRDRWTGESLAMAGGDLLGAVVVQEDGTNEITNPVIQIGVTLVS